MSDPKRANFADVIPISAMTDWTDEQWAAHDARVAAERARALSLSAVTLAAPNLEELGWPSHALRAARGADEKWDTTRRMLGHKFSERSVVVLSGFAGCGKTVAAAAWAIRSGLRVCFLRAATFAASSRYDDDLRAERFNAPALVLDDLGAEYLDAKGSFLVDLDELVDTYYGNERPLVITTNLTAGEFKARYGARIERRIRECGVWFSASTKGGAS